VSLPLPQPFQEISLVDDPNTMMVVPSVPGSSIVGPMYLSKEAHRQLEDFCLNINAFQPLIIVGPPKCSKSSLLRHLLPSMVVSKPLHFSPVFVRLSFSLGDNPMQAAVRIKNELSEVVNAFGLSKSIIRGADSKAMLNIPGWIDKIGTEFAKRNLQLWIMMDECQVPKLDGCFSLIFSQVINWLFGLFSGSAYQR
jgi:hypothetical protein